MKGKISLPELAYFTQKNTMIGSCTPEDFIGNPLAPVFNYRVYFAKGDDTGTASIEAIYFIDCKCYELTDKEKVIKKCFEASEEGIFEASKWLEDEYNNYLRTV